MLSKLRKEYYWIKSLTRTCLGPAISVERAPSLDGKSKDFLPRNLTVFYGFLRSAGFLLGEEIFRKMVKLNFKKRKEAE